MSSIVLTVNYVIANVTEYCSLPTQSCHILYSARQTYKRFNGSTKPEDIMKVLSCEAVQFGQKACVITNMHEAATIKNNVFVLHVVKSKWFQDEETQNNICISFFLEKRGSLCLPERHSQFRGLVGRIQKLRSNYFLYFIFKIMSRQFEV